MNPLLSESAAGRHWPLATEDDRRAFCAIVQTFRAGEEFLLGALDMLLGGRCEALSALALTEIVAMVLDADQEAAFGFAG